MVNFHRNKKTIVYKLYPTGEYANLKCVLNEFALFTDADVHTWTVKWLEVTPHYELILNCSCFEYYNYTDQTVETVLPTVHSLRSLLACFYSHPFFPSPLHYPQCLHSAYSA